MNAVFSSILQMLCLGILMPRRFSFAEEGGGGASVSVSGGEQVGKTVQKDQAKDSGKAAEEGASSGSSDGKVLTEDQYKLLMATRDRKSKEQLEELNASYQSAIKQLKDEITELRKTGGKKEPEDDQHKKKQQTPEFFDLQKKLEETKNRLNDLAKKNDELRESERNFRFTTLVKDALSANGCTSEKVDMAFRVISPDLKLDDSGNRVFITVETDSGDVDLDVSQYVKEYVKKKILPEFFNGQQKPGSPASGKRGSNSDYDFTMDQVRDPAFYKAHYEEIQTAIDRGRVKMD